MDAALRRCRQRLRLHRRGADRRQVPHAGLHLPAVQRSRTRRTSAPAGAFDISGPGAGCEARQPAVPLLDRHRPDGRADHRMSRSDRPQDLPRRTTRRPIPTASTARRGKPFEYWLLWPAPAHNSALNKIYYNPRLTYDPPIGDDGNPLPNMNAANTSNWTQVPGRPVGGDRRQGRPHRQGHRRPVVQLRLDAGQRHSGNPFVNNAATAAPTAPSMRRRRRRPTATTATRGHRSASPPTTRFPRSTRPRYARQERVDDVQGQRDGEPELLPERQRDLVQHQQRRVAARLADRNLQPAGRRQPAAARRPAPARRARHLPGRPDPDAPATGADLQRPHQPESATAYRRQDLHRHAACVQPGRADLRHRNRADLQLRAARPATTSRRRPATSRRRPATSMTAAPTSWLPPGCNSASGDPEAAKCTLVQQCKKKCSVSKLDCTGNASVCTDIGKCSIRQRQSCTAATAATDCPTIAGTCSIDGTSRARPGAVRDGQDAAARPAPTARRPPAPTSTARAALHRNDCTATCTCPTTNRCGGTVERRRLHDVAEQLRARRRQVQHQTGTSARTQLPDCRTAAPAHCSRQLRHRHAAAISAPPAARRSPARTANRHL